MNHSRLNGESAKRRSQDEQRKPELSTATQTGSCDVVAYRACDRVRAAVDGGGDHDRLSDRPRHQVEMLQRNLVAPAEMRRGFQRLQLCGTKRGNRHRHGVA